MNFKVADMKTFYLEYFSHTLPKNKEALLKDKIL
jgi:hypothetical protein